MSWRGWTTDENASRTLKAVIKVKVIKVIKHFPLALFSYSIILNFNIILYIYSVPPESLMTLMTLTLMTGKSLIGIDESL